MKSLEVYNPFTNKKIGTPELTSKEKLEKIIQEAYQITKDTSKILEPYQRIKILEQFEALVKKNKNKIINIAIEEGGKPLVDTKIEYERALIGIRIARSHIEKNSGRQIPMGINESAKNKLCFTIKEPIGLIYSLSAFNHPINLIIHQVVPAIAAGCPVIIKPAIKTPYTCELLVDLLSKTDLPKHYCNLITVDNSTASKIAQDPRISMMSFIGSPKIGWMLRSILPPGAKCVLEHGGTAPMILAHDVNKDNKAISIDNIVDEILKGAFYHAGQVCVSTQKIYIHEDNIDEIVEKLIYKTNKIKVGDPKLPQTQVGPIIDNESLKRIDNWVKEATKEGGKILTGGKIIHNTCYEPTLILDPDKKSKVSTLEVFGPILCIYRYKDLDNVINEINQSPYSFNASIYTSDVNTAFNFAKKIEVATALINEHTAYREDWMPFGGRKHSGLGMGGIINSIEEMCAEKTVLFKIT